MRIKLQIAEGKISLFISTLACTGSKVSTLRITYLGGELRNIMLNYKYRVTYESIKV
jgi:hypothetical protein